ncbi:MAG: hydrogenase 3 maturation endopeptidase HyCI [Candidatus Omnitrophota bacterium]
MFDTIQKDLKTGLRGKIVVLGVGNPLRSDDGFGSILASRLKDKVSAVVINAESAPENHLNRLVNEKADTILILDAADFEGKPAQIKLLDPRQAMKLLHFSTHNLPLSIIVEFLEYNCKAKVLFLAMQPKSINFGEKLSVEVENKVKLLEKLLLKLLPKPNN